ncbi:hypothetical protein B0J15DRAFT_120845 [Fusarium solani]|uniref:Uncharacterized protein n=1 Tax=Fusarium solani TaxID=169388 RepID=A0A9P9L552_FUSSL|nr:uncharacterized protein B0J15DRAFT_120845 [Fusarium solani]KAH7274114.1 hypothetical protein B0J15DRAFT_120845 [Fusarium solani]
MYSPSLDIPRHPAASFPQRNTQGCIFSLLVLARASCKDQCARASCRMRKHLFLSPYLLGSESFLEHVYCTVRSTFSAWFNATAWGIPSKKDAHDSVPVGRAPGNHTEVGSVDAVQLKAKPGKTHRLRLVARGSAGLRHGISGREIRMAGWSLDDTRLPNL